MGLKEELSQMADSMREQATSHPADAASLLGLVLTTAAELKGMAKALPDGSTPQVWGGQHPLIHTPVIDPVIEQMKQRESARVMRQEEAGAVQMRECVGGPAADTMAAVHPNMPVGSKCYVAGVVYELNEDGKLYAQAVKGKT